MYLIYLYLGQTSLTWAAKSNQIDIVKVLLEYEADVNAIDNYG